MAAKKQWAGVALVLVASALTVFGIVFAATDTNPSGVAKDNLVLHGFPPTSSSLLVKVSTGGSYELSADMRVNFTTNDVDAIVHFPLIFSETSVDLRLIDKTVYARAADVSSGAWLSLPVHAPPLFGVALEMTKPDIYLIKGFNGETKTKSGYFTTYDYTLNNAAVINVLGPKNVVLLGSLNWSITVGNEGEVTQSTLIVRSKKLTTTYSVQVLSYNQRTHIVAPPAAQVKSISGSTFPSLFGSTDFTTLLIPKDLTAIGRAKVS
ncbi:MAG TPA: hypothetical protein VIJ99_08480 [Acidimicrobiales bacterium]